MGAADLRSRLFFVMYAGALLFGLAWVQFPYVREDISAGLVSVYAFFGVALAYVAIRAFLVLGRHVGRKWDNVWLVIDLALITAAVYWTGGLGSDAAMLYCWPLFTASIQRRPRTTAALGGAILILYTGVALLDGSGAVRIDKLATHLFIVIVATAVATCYALTEVACVEENTRLREDLAVAEYRTELSREMHDSVLQHLSRIVARLELAKLLARDRPEEGLRVASDERLTARQAADQLRYLVRFLSSPELDRKGLLGALPDHLEMFTQRSGAEVDLEIDGDPTQLASELEKAAFRIIQEALTNVEKYANASSVDIRIALGQDSLECVIHDDGCGFDPATAPQAPGRDGGFGLVSMRDRAESVDGRVEVSSAPGEGTTVTFAAPICAA